MSTEQPKTNDQNSTKKSSLTLFIILFIAFIVAFRGGIKETIIFGVIGSVIIYGVNIVRISFLTAMIYEYQHYQDVLHNIVFPLIIYGTTFLLWIVWVHKFSNYKK